ncbi:hypothetical protein SEA_FIREMAN_2 [Microbacterium phage Fireman]|uniref:Uncharacterized protein n=1 Tax=Microbacterium phage Fireman TaxID=2530118 RepID=A0A4P8VZK6_9CAUD|nr:hypothetical protein HOV22_gp03 [Microbacterium phage Fireman]QCS26969.1 hypothetical protein SEA_FIREMAN_2 [Microbacterium phage Fireman]
MTRCMSVRLGDPSTPCTLGQSSLPYIEYPGDIIGYEYRGGMLPVWAPKFLPSLDLKPVRMAEVEAGIERMAEQVSRAANTNGESIVEALRSMADRLRGR